MKLPPQLASLLPVSPGVEVTLRQGTGVFSATMQPLMPAPSGNEQTPAVKDNPSKYTVGPTGTISPLGMSTPMGGEDSEAENPKSTLPVFSQAATAEGSLSEGTGRLTWRQFSAPISLPVKESAAVPIVAPLKKVPAESEEVSARAGMNSEHREISASGERSGLERKRPAERQQKIDQSSQHTAGVATDPASVSITFPVVPQIETPRSDTPKKNPKISVESRVASADYRKLPAPQSAPIVPATDVGPKALQKVMPERISPDRTAEAAMFHKTVLARESTVTDASSRPIQRYSLIPEPHKQISQVNVSQENPHAVGKAANGTIVTATPSLAEKVQVQPAPATTMFGHQPAASHVSTVITSYREEIAPNAHRIETGATHVLQRMDSAVPSGVVQLRADTRHLNVGVASSSLGWVEVRATAGPSGTVDATLHAETTASAHVLAAQSKEMTEYARDHSVQLGQLSVGVETGDAARDGTHSAPESANNEKLAPMNKDRNRLANREPGLPHEEISLISVRA